MSPFVSGRDQPLQAFLSSPIAKGGKPHPVVGVAIFASAARKLLIVQRAAKSKFFPNMYELPGGKYDDEDETLRRTVERETLEETGFVVKEIVREFEGFEYTTGSGSEEELYKQFNFVVEVEPREEGEGGLPSPKLSDREHQAYAWIGPGDSLESYPMSESMAKVVRNALEAISAPGS
ncbi:NUDIX hydrolase domain-like protein [Mycena crocata]|nr:NUDIX hydrolase domain-like protein [Mycena crocata]